MLWTYHLSLFCGTPLMLYWAYSYPTNELPCARISAFIATVVSSSASSYLGQQQQYDSPAATNICGQLTTLHCRLTGA